jgi:hypothetical protein
MHPLNTSLRFGVKKCRPPEPPVMSAAPSLMPAPEISRSYFYFTKRFFALRCLPVTIETFKKEIAAAVKAYDKFIVCLEKSPEEFEQSLSSLMEKAITAFENRAPGMRHGLALDKQVTIILSQSDTARPLCGIYFNLHSPYQKNALPSTVKAVEKKPSPSSND